MKFSAASNPSDARRRFVFIDDEGEARELYDRECDYLATAYDGADGARPYIKKRYDSLTPDGLMHGFLERRHLPRRVRVESRSGTARLPLPRPYARARVIAGHAVASLVAAAVTGYAALLVGAFLAMIFMRPGMRGLGIVLFVAAAFFGAAFYFVAGPLNLLLSADRWRVMRFVAATASFFGFFAGAAWVLWLHGDPSRILLFR